MKPSWNVNAENGIASIFDPKGEKVAEINAPIRSKTAIAHRRDAGTGRMSFHSLPF